MYIYVWGLPCQKYRVYVHCIYTPYMTVCIQACATTPSFGFFDRLDGPYRICTVQDGASTICLKSAVPTVQGRCHRTVRF